MNEACEHGPQVPPEGPPDALIRVVGEAPGEREAELRRPFVGPTGAELRRAMKAAGVPSERCRACAGRECALCTGCGVTFPEVLIGNTICWRPPGNDYTTVKADELVYCMSRHLPPAPAGSLTFLVGGKALAAHFPALTSIEVWRGGLLPLLPSGAAGGATAASWAVPLLHPSYIFRGQWALRPTLTWDFAGGLRGWRAGGLKLPQLVSLSDLPPGPTLALDIENAPDRSISLCGLSTDGVKVAQLEPAELAQLQGRLDAARVIFAHNASWDVQHLERAGLNMHRERVIDTMVAQAFLQPDLDSGLDDACSYTLSGEQVFWKALGRHESRYKKLREQTEWVWEQVMPVFKVMTPEQRERFYNQLDVAMTWRLGVKQLALLETGA